MSEAVDLRSDHAKIVHEILEDHLPDGVSVRVFGSRARWTAKDYSDLDLALKGKGRLPQSVLPDLAERFSDSDLPFKVDVVDWHSVSPDFKQIIDRDGVKLPWPIFPLRELVDPSRGICYGIVQPGAGSNNGVPIIRVNNFRSGGLDLTDALRVDPAVEAKHARSRLHGGELLVTLVGSVGQSVIAGDDLKNWNVARAVGVVPIADKLLTRWVKLVFESEPAQDFLLRRANTTVQVTVNLRDLAELPVPVPPRRTMERMVGLLDVLDDKIELNRRMNETLEAMARAIFKDWFVDFGPTRAKMEGRAPYLAPDIWSLFPDRLDVDGRPEGWEAVAIRDAADIISGGTPRKETTEFWNGQIPWISPKVMTGIHVSDSDDRVTPLAIGQGTRLAPSGSVLVMVRGMGLHQGVRISQARRDVTFNQDVKAMVPKTLPATYLLYGLLEAAPYLFSKVEASGHGTGRLPTDIIDGLKFVAPPHHARPPLVSPIDALNEKIAANDAENITLSATRDLLLPKLMSGEIRIRDAEKIAGDAA